MSEKSFDEILAAEIDAQDKRYPFAIFRMRRSSLIPGTRKSVESDSVFVIDFVRHGFMDMGSIARFERTGKRLVYLHIPDSFMPKDQEAQKALSEIRDHMDRYQAMRAEVAREMAAAAMGEPSSKVVELPGNGIQEKLARKLKGKPSIPGGEEPPGGELP